MSKRRFVFGVLLALLLIGLSLPLLSSFFLFNLANTQISRAMALPTDAPRRAALLANANANLSRAQTLFPVPRFSLAQARLALAQDFLPGALAAFDSADSATRNDFIAQFGWADAAWRLGQRETALPHWRAAGAREYFRQQMNRAQYAHQWKQAEDAARIAIGIDSSHAEAHYVLGNALSMQEVNSVEAMAELEQARALTQDQEFLATILSRQGEIFASQKENQKALAAFAKARAAAPLDPRPRTGYAIVSLQMDANAKSESVALLRQVVDDSPWYAAAFIALADMSEGEGEAWLKKGVAQNPKDASLLFEMGKWYARQKRVAEAKTMFVAALQNESRAELRQPIARALADLPSP